MTLTELLLLIIVIGGAAYAGYLFGRWSVLNEPRQGGPAGHRSAQDSPLPGPNEFDTPAHGAPPPASAGGRHADATAGGAPRPRSAPPPASAGGSSGDGPPSGGPQPRRSVPPPPARAGLLSTGEPDKPRGKS